MAVFKKGELKLLWNFYIYLIFWTFSLMIQPYTFIYFRDLGFSYTQIASFTSVLMLSLFIFELPTGIVADLWGRKRSVFIGLLIVGIAPIVIALSTNYLVILLSYIFIGMGITFISGAEEALIVDNLKHHKRDDLINEYYVKMSSLMGVGTVIAFALGSLIVKKWGIKPLWYIWGLGYLLSAILLQLIKEYGFKRRGVKRGLIREFIKPLKMSVTFIKKSRSFFNYLIGSSLVTVLFVQRELWNVLLTDNGLKRSSLSIIASLTSLLTIFLPWISKKFKNKPINKVLIGTTLLRVIILTSVLLVNSSTLYLGVILFTLLGSINSFESPITSTYVQSRIDSNIRATMGSFMNMIYSLTGAAAGVLIGLIADKIGVTLSIFAFSLFGLISLMFYRGVSPKINRGADNEVRYS